MIIIVAAGVTISSPQFLPRIADSYCKSLPSSDKATGQAVFCRPDPDAARWAANGAIAAGVQAMIYPLTGVAWLVWVRISA
jgi:hypothetical protein